MTHDPTDGYVTHDDLTEALRRVGAEHDTLTTQHTALVELVTELAHAVSALGEKVTVASTPGEPGGRARWRWRTLAPGPARTALWWQVTGFVSWYNARYGHSSDRTAIWPCWPQHPVVVEEITALMVAHDAAYAGDDATDSIVAWHDRWLWPAIDRLHVRPGGFGACTAASHEIRHTVDVDDISPDALAAAIGADAQAARAQQARDHDLTPPGEREPPAEPGLHEDVPVGDEPEPTSW